MSSDFPIGAYKKFSSRLAKAEGRTCFDRLTDYYSSVVERKDPKKRWDIEHRFRSGKFFHYPGESDRSIYRATCFENSVHFLMAARELYPRSNPKLAYVDEGTRGVHSIMTFNHQGKLFGGDFSFKFLSPIYFKGKKIIHSDDQSIKFKSFTPVSDSEVQRVIGRLRGSRGIEHYLSEGGQKLVDDPFAFRPYEVFARYDDGKLSSELRFMDFELIRNTGVRRKYDLNRDEFGIEFLLYKLANWSNLIGEKKIGWNSEDVPIGEGVLLDKRASLKSFEDPIMVNFLKRWGSYHYTLKSVARGEHRALKDSFIYSKKDRQFFFDKQMPDVYISYLRGLVPSSFVDHSIDYDIFRRDPVALKKVSGNKNAKSWRDVKAPGRRGFFTESVIVGLQGIARRELGEHRLLSRKVIALLKG